MEFFKLSKFTALAVFQILFFAIFSAFVLPTKVNAAVSYYPWQWTHYEYNFYDQYLFSATDSANNIYLTNLSEQRIEKYDANGNFIRNYMGYWDYFAAGNASYPRGIAIDSSNNIIISVSTNNTYKIKKIANDGTLLLEFGQSGANPENINGPQDVATDSADNIYVADFGSDSVKKFDSNGNFIGRFTSNDCMGITVDASGNIYTTSGHYLYKYNSSFTQQWFVGGYGSGDTQFATPKGIDVDGAGNIWIADSGVYRYKQVDTSGVFVSKFGTYGTGNYQFQKPTSVSVDSLGNIITLEDDGFKKFSALSSTGYQVTNLNAALDIKDKASNISIKSGTTYGSSGIARPLSLWTTAGRLLSEINVDLAADVSWPLVLGDSDRTTGKSYVTNLTSAPGASLTHTLYVPIPLNTTSQNVYLCPDATDLVSVTTSCSNGVSRSFGSFIESFGNIVVSQILNPIDGVHYWKIDGMTGSGGIYQQLAFSGLGDGSVGNPYQITTCNQLQEMQNDLSSNFILSNNIDCSLLSYNGGLFLPIGSSTAPFIGSLNGNNFTISNLSINKPFDSVADINNVTGLFGYISGGTVTDLDVVNVDIYGNNYVGALAGYITSATITNVTASGSINSNTEGYEGDYFGGLIGRIEGASVITNSSSSVSINYGDLAYWMGGFAGMINGTTIIDNSFATGAITTGIDSDWIGGFVGDVGLEFSNSDVTITNSYATGNLTVGDGATISDGDLYWIGGFAGMIGSSENNSTSNASGMITNCYATGDIVAYYHGNYWMGGFVGQLSGNSIITNSYATGSVSSGYGANGLGGFVGWISGKNPQIYLSWGSGDININNSDAFGIGGFVGWLGVNGTANDYYIIEDSYATGDITVGALGLEDQWSASLGGFAGEVEGMISTTPVEISSCFSMGSITTIGEVIESGGFLGNLTGGSIIIDNTASLGTSVEATYGFSGYAGNITVATAQSMVIKNSYTRTNLISNYLDIHVPDYAEISGFVSYAEALGTGTLTLTNNYAVNNFSQAPSAPAIVSTTLANPITDLQETFTVTDASSIQENTYLLLNQLAGAPYSTTLTAPMTAGQFTADVVDAIGFDTYSYIVIDPGVVGKEEVVQISTMAGNVLNLSSREGTITHDIGAVVQQESYSSAELIYVISKNGNDIFVRRGEGNTYNRAFLAGTTLNEIQLPTPQFSGFIDNILGGTVLVQNAYWDEELSGQPNSAEGIGLTTAQMKDPDSFTGFNFSTYWSKNSLVNDGYPFLSFDDPTIASLELTAGILQPSFHRHTHVYNVDVDGSVNDISFKALMNEGLVRSITIDGAPIADDTYTASFPLNDGLNQFTYALISRDWRPINYIINVNKVSTPVTPTPTNTPIPTAIPTATVNPSNTPTPSPTQLPGYTIPPRSSLTPMPTTSSIVSATPTIQVDKNRCLIANSIIKKSYSDKGVNLSFSIEKADACLVRYGNTSGSYSNQANAIKTNSSFSAYIDYNGFGSEDNIYYRIECNTGELQCTLSDLIYRNPNTPTIPFLSFNWNLGVFEFITLTGLALGIVPISIAFPKFWLYAFLWIFPKKKKSPWGIIYDFQSLNPIPFAIARIYDIQGQVLKQTVSDLQGRFSFILDPGNYQLVVEHQDYNKITKPIFIANRDAQINNDVVMIKVAASNAFWPKFKRSMGVFASKSYLFIGFFGLIFALLAMVTNFELINIIIFGLYVLQLIIYLSIRPDRNIGFVNEDTTKERIKGAFVRVQDVTQGRQVDVQMTDERGRFGFNLDKGDYLLLTDAAGYEVVASTLPETTLNSGVKAFKYNTEQKNVNFEMKKV